MKIYKMEKMEIDKVRAFWTENPLLTGELEEPVGTKGWFKKFDQIKTQDVFCGGMPQWIPKGLDKKKILEVGHGPGYWFRVFGEKDVIYHGIDLSPKSVELAKESQRLYKLKGEVKIGNAEQIDFPEEYFDYVLSEGVIHHTPNTQKCVDEIYRVLAKDGRASVSLYYKNILLRSAILFKLTLFLMNLLNVGLKGRGREKMVNASSVDEFVRMYDGADNPIGKAYTKSEIKSMFSQFSEIKFSLYYLPARSVKFKLPTSFVKFLSSIFGLMILIELKK